jgi:hypothetical protein
MKYNRIKEAIDRIVGVHVEWVRGKRPKNAHKHEKAVYDRATSLTPHMVQKMLNCLVESESDAALLYAMEMASEPEDFPKWAVVHIILQKEGGG